MYRFLLYPLVVAVAASGLMTGRWLEQSGLLHGLLERGGTAAGVPERVFQEGPGQPPAEVDVQQQDQPATPEQPAGGEPGTTETSVPEEPPEVEETEEPSPTESETVTETESPSPAPSG